MVVSHICGKHFSPRHNEVGSNAVTWNDNDEMMYDYSIYLWKAANDINMYNDCAYSSFL